MVSIKITREDEISFRIARRACLFASVAGLLPRSVVTML
jgi:hypothetical protein